MKRSVVLVVLALAACSSSSSSAQDSSTALTVFAASSLTAAFTQIGTDFESAHPGTTVTFNFGSSTDLATQISSEGTADVFASASRMAMDTVEEAPGVADRQNFATNHLVIITPTNDPGGVSSLEDLVEPGLQIVLAAEGVPVGDYARQMLDETGLAKDVMPNVVSNEPDDAAVVAKVKSGEADAGIVYTSDISSSDVRAVTIPDGQNVVATYPIAEVTAAPAGDAAGAFVEFVVGTDGQATLEQYGFGPPPSG